MPRLGKGTQRIVIISRQRLLAEGIKSLLGRDPAIRVRTVDPETTRGFDPIRSLRPDVILMETGDAGVLLGPLAHLSREGTLPRLIIVAIDQNMVIVYDGHRLPAADPADILSAIRCGARMRRGVGGPPGEGSCAARVPTKSPPPPKRRIRPPASRSEDR